MERISIANAGIKPSLYRKIKSHAGGSMFRLNAQAADLYTFTVDDDGNDWSGGWSWKITLVHGMEI